MRAILAIIFFIVYYLLIGGVHYWYFRKYKRADFEKEKLFYLLGYGGRFRFGVSIVLAIFTADMILFGTILGVQEP